MHHEGVAYASGHGADSMEYVTRERDAGTALERREKRRAAGHRVVGRPEHDFELPALKGIWFREQDAGPELDGRRPHFDIETQVHMPGIIVARLVADRLNRHPPVKLEDPRCLVDLSETLPHAVVPRAELFAEQDAAAPGLLDPRERGQLGQQR